jgi:hypothetical protein
MGRGRHQEGLRARSKPIVFDVVPLRQYVGAETYRKDWQTFLGALKSVKFAITDLAKFVRVTDVLPQG